MYYYNLKYKYHNLNYFKILLITLTILVCTTTTSQNEKKLDSVFQVLKTLKQDTNRVNTLNVISLAISRNDPDSALYYTKQSLILALKLNYKTGLSNGYFLLGSYHQSKGNLNEALTYHLKSLKICEETKNYMAKGSILGNIGIIYETQGNYPKALEYYFSSLKLFEFISDKSRSAWSYLALANVFSTQLNYVEGLKNYHKSLKLYQELGKNGEIASIYEGIGTLYYEQGKYIEAMNNLNIALDFYKQNQYKVGLSNCYMNIGLVNYSIGNYSEALKNYETVLKIKQEIDDKNGISAYYINMGSLEEKLGHLLNAKNYYSKGLSLAKEIGSMDTKKLSYQGLAKVDSALGNDAASLKNYKLYIIYKDSIDNDETKKQTIQTSIQYEFDKKEIAAKAEQDKRDAIVVEEKQRQRLVLYVVIGGLSLVVVFAVFMVNRFRVTNKQKQIIEIKEKQTQQQNLIITEQKHLVEEKHKEITDSINYAERIQRSFLATEKQLNENLSNYFVLFKPKDIVSGDFYWSAKLNNGNFALVTADSTGHGVPGAIMSLLNVTSLEKAIEHYTNPADILNHTRQTIITRLKKDGSADGGKDGMDCSITVYDFATKKLIIAAANNPVWIVRKRHCEDDSLKQSQTKEIASLPRNDGNYEVIELKPDKMPVGKHDKDSISFTQQEIELQTGDVVYTLTDGFPDQFGGEKGKKFMSKNLRELLVKNVHLPLQEQKQLLEATFKNWVGDLEQVDDVTVIGVRIG